jgi:radical SAM superfamily enzyme YgiQ (UPF0313 family)
MRVLLVSCYELGHQPLALAGPAAHILAETPAAVECLDLAVEPFDSDKVRRADVVGISVPMHTALRMGVRAAARVRSLNPTCHVCFYGLYATLNRKYLLGHLADSVIGGEYERPLINLVQSLSNGADVAGDLEGVSTPAHQSDPFLGRQIFLPPIRSLLPPLEKYAHLDTGEDLKLVGYVEASRGCLHTCLHCPITPVYKGSLRVIQRDIIRKDIAALVHMGAQHITFGDPDFLNAITHSLRVARQLHEDFPGLTFDMTTKVEHIVEHPALFEELRELGCIFVVSAVESLNDRILQYLEKGHTRDDVVAALEIAGQAGIALRPSLVSFTPWTTLEDYIDVLDFVEEHGLIYHVDPVQYSIRLLVPPGSSLLNTPQMKPFLGELNRETFSYEWKHSDPRMDALQEAVGAIAEAAVRRKEDPSSTFDKIKALALSLHGNRRFSPPGAHEIPRAVRPAQLTESWFC